MRLEDFIDEAEKEKTTAKIQGNELTYKRAEDLLGMLKELRLYRSLYDISHVNHQ